MADPRGFIEVHRVEGGKRLPAERVQDWREFTLPLADADLQEQGRRCMDCGVSFCHVGSAKGVGCPINNLIPDWNELVYRGMWREALNRLHMTNNFPEFTGTTCPAPCEGSCVLGIGHSPVTIKSIELAIVERGFNEGWIQHQPSKTRTGKEVAIIGSGPAGLAAADQLNSVGHQVHVFEQSDRIGGLLVYGIPTMKLDKKTVERRVRLLADSGVKFHTCTRVEGAKGEGASPHSMARFMSDAGVMLQSITLAELRSQFDAVILCTGALEPRGLLCPSEGVQGVHTAMEFLTRTTHALLNSGFGDHGPISAAGKNVIVVGAGDTGTDAVATALRQRTGEQGPASLTQLYYREEPSVGRGPGCPPWPLQPSPSRMDYGQGEAAAVFGQSPWLWDLSITGLKTQEGVLKGVVTQRIDWQASKSGSTVYVSGSERELAADLLIVAAGFTGTEPIAQAIGVGYRNGLVEAAEGCYATNIPGIFTAGDCRRGASLVVWAIKEGRGVARAVDEFLMGHASVLPGYTADMVA